MLKWKQLTKMISLSLLPITAIATTVSMTKYSSSEEYIRIKINKEDKVFKNVQEASNWVLSNKADAKVSLKMGDPSYLNKDDGVINPESVLDYYGDDKHIKPAYKMMNGEYTPDRQMALKSFLGRSHLVGQYYDGMNFHEGNAAGLAEAKEVILSRQKEAIVPFYDVPLNDGSSGTVRINPFNKNDVNSLQDKVFQIYKNNGFVGTNHITTTFLLPSSTPGEKIGVAPSNPAIGLQLNDLMSGQNSVDQLITQWIKSKITFDFHVGLSGDDNSKDQTPYRFRSIGGQYFWNDKKDPFSYLGPNSSSKISEDEKSMYFENISYSNFIKYKDSFDAFLTYKGFWNHFDQGQNKGASYYSTWAKAQKAIYGPDTKSTKNNIFGASIEIHNDDAWRSGSGDGWDITINDDDASYWKYFTTATLTPKLDPKINKMSTNELINNFKKDFGNSLRSNNILTKLSPSLQNDILKLTLGKKLGTAVNQVGALDPIGSGWTDMLSDKAGNTPNMWHEPKKVANNNKKLNILSNFGFQPETSQPKQNSLENIIHNYKATKMLLVNKTPIMSISKEKSNVKITNKDIYSKISLQKMGNMSYYIYKPTKKWWDDIKPQQDFKSKYIFVGEDPQQIKRHLFGEIKANKSYSSTEPPLIFWNANNNWKRGVDEYMPISLAKILSDKEDGIHSIYKLDSKSEFFYNDKDVNDRKIEINQNFFEPALIYVIYNDNDEVIDEFKSVNSNLRFDGKQTIKANATSILTEYIRKSKKLWFAKKNDGTWTEKPISNHVFSVYNLTWEGQQYMFENFSNLKHFIFEWVKNNSRTFRVKG